MAELRGLLKNNDRARRVWLLFLRGPRNEGFRTSRSLVWPLKFIIRSNYHLFYIRDELFYLLKIITFSKQCKVALMFTARSTKVLPLLIYSHSFMQTLTNQKLRTVSSWLLIGLNLHERTWINQNQSHFWAPFFLSGKSLKLAEYRPWSHTYSTISSWFLSL